MKPRIKHLMFAIMLLAAVLALSGTALAKTDFYAVRTGEYRMVNIQNSFGKFGSYPTDWLAEYGTYYGHWIGSGKQWMELAVYDVRYPYRARPKSVYEPVILRTPDGPDVPLIRFVGTNGAVIRANSSAKIGAPDPYAPH